VGTATIPTDEVETWHPGDRKWPTDPEMTLRVWEKRIQMKEADLADMVQDLRGLKTYEEAVNWIEERTAERAKSEILAPPKAPEIATGAKPTLAQRLGGGAKLQHGTANPAPVQNEGTNVAPLKATK